MYKKAYTLLLENQIDEVRLNGIYTTIQHIKNSTHKEQVAAHTLDREHVKHKEKDEQRMLESDLIEIEKHFT
ncbi:MAG: hypothetical protein WCL18_07330 [bacterium]